MPRRPLKPAPRIRCISTVSAWSSAWCPTATAFAPTSRASVPRYRYRVLRAASSSESRSVAATARTSTAPTVHGIYQAAQSAWTRAASSKASSLKQVVQVADVQRHAVLWGQFAQQGQEAQRVHATGDAHDDDLSRSQQSILLYRCFDSCLEFHVLAFIAAADSG